MIRRIAIQNKAERDQWLARHLLERDSTPQLRQNLANGLCKVVIGPRRAGKSVQCFLALKQERFAYLNFDDESFLRLEDYDDIPAVLSEVYGDVDYYFFDEIQNLPNWELFVNKLQRRGYNLILTGSNAKLLSRELGSALTGRHLQFELLPLGVREFLRSRELGCDDDLMCLPERRGRVLGAITDYLTRGGFPEVSIGKIDPRDYLGTLIDAILYKDIVVRHEIRSPRLLGELFLYLVSNFAREYTFNSLKNALGASSVATVEHYLSYLEEAFLLFSLQRYSHKIKETIRAPRKLYVVDNGLVTARARLVSEDRGRLLENAVFLELLRQGRCINKNLFYFRTRRELEVDFLLTDSHRSFTLIQVCHAMDDPITRQREIRALTQAATEIEARQALIVTWDREEIVEAEDCSIHVVPFWKWATSPCHSGE